jgi:hypothetical protein
MRCRPKELQASRTPGGLRADERLALLLDLREEGKRVLHHQAVAMEQLDAKTQHTLGLAVAALAGAIALLTFTADRLAGRVGAPFVVLFGAAGAVNLAAIGVLLASYVGYRRQTEIAVGPSLDWLARTAEDPTWTREEAALNLLRAYPGYAAFNAASMRRATAGRRLGIYLLAAAALLYAGICLYAFARTVVV